MFTNFFPDAKEEDVNKFSSNFTSINRPISPAHIQGYILRFKRSISDALSNFQILEDSLEALATPEPATPSATPESVDSGCPDITDKLSKALTALEEENANDQ